MSGLQINFFLKKRSLHLGMSKTDKKDRTEIGEEKHSSRGVAYLKSVLTKMLHY
jgi:hypothetical protein